MIYYQIQRKCGSLPWRIAPEAPDLFTDPQKVSLRAHAIKRSIMEPLIAAGIDSNAEKVRIVSLEERCAVEINES